MAEQITTKDGTEFSVEEWQCPGCGRLQCDTLHPTLGPFISCTCDGCGKSWNNEQLDERSRGRWEDARATAEAYRALHPEGPEITYRDHLIVGYYGRGGPGGWLPPGDATDADCANLAGLGLLRRCDQPNADCFEITDAGRAQRYIVEGE